MANLYRSVFDVDTSEKFVISFDATNFGMVGIGVDIKNVSELDKIDKIVYIDTLGNILREGHSKIYNIEGTIISKKETDNSTFFGRKIEIDNGKVYEEVKDISEYDPETDTENVLVRNKILYKHYPGRYIYEDGIVKVDIGTANLVGIYSFENGEIKNETYLNNIDLNTKIRFVLANNAKTFDIARLDGDLYEKILTILFKEKTEAGYIFLYLDKTEISNLLINYSQFIEPIKPEGDEKLDITDPD